ncbi:AzlC family ABC transporter permease [Frisingicoccus sp.]|uniref:AzlC family ABC transporter permease n=1 Tax=Frisingicoccus sp. TaxID=1918627 RepID=UPI002EB15F20|nr:AzlC family ABC transporter permease [Frisingicoccus sp.]
MNRIKRNFVRTLPVMAGYIVLAIGFGIVLQNHGYGVGWALLMSLLIYAGSMQFAAINLISSGAGLITVALTTLMVNARHLFYGISMVDKYKDTKPYKPYLIFGLTDETYSLVCDGPGLTKEDYFQITLFDQIYWVTGSVLGVVIGERVPFDFAGVDFALTALFVSIVADQWVTNKDHVPTLIGVISSVICLFIFGGNNFLIPSMVVITAGLTVLKIIRREEDKND